MVHALAIHFPFTGGEALALYQPSPLERYFPIAPGIEVSVHPDEGLMGEKERGKEALVYNRQGQLNYSKKKGILVDTRL